MTFEEWWADNCLTLDHRDILRTAESAWVYAQSCKVKNDLQAELDAPKQPTDERAEPTIAAVLPNGKTCTNVYDAYDIGFEQAHSQLPTNSNDAVDAKRYRLVRRLNPREFAEIYDKNIKTGIHFDELVTQAMKEGK